MLSYNNRYQFTAELSTNPIIAKFLLLPMQLFIFIGILLNYNQSIAVRDIRTVQIGNKSTSAIDHNLYDDNSLQEKRKTLEHWHELLVGIKNLMIKERSIKQPKAFISYAWEDTSTEEGRIENSKLQRYLENLRDDLQTAGISVFLDIGDMHGNMKKRMEENLTSSDVIITINTPRFRVRALAEPQTNLGFEYKLTLKKAEEIPYGIFPLHYKGSFDEAFGKWGEDKELKELKGYLIRDCLAPENYKSMLVATQRPLGIIPAIYNLDCDNDTEYSALIQNWRWSEFTSIPPLNRDFVGRKEFLTNIALALKDNNVQAISGMGGIGKSEIAMAYAHRHENEYGAIRLLSAESGNIRLEFERMADLFGIDSKGMSAQELSSAIYKKIGNYKWLLIFDNADDYDSIKDYLPSTPREQQHILITSRNQHWRGCLIIDRFTDGEVYSYAKLILPSITKEESGKIGRAIGHLPLTLTQATAYIKGVGIGVDAYLKLYKKAENGGTGRYPSSVAQTIAISTEKLKAKSPDAAKMLLICSYLDPDNIPLKLLKRKQLLKDRETIYEALIALKSYSLVEPAKTPDSIQVNRLTQAVTRDEYEKQGGDKLLILSEIAEALTDYCPWDKVTDSDFERARLLLPHMQSVLNYIESYTQTAKEQRHPVIPIETRLLSSIAKTLADFGNYEEARDMLRKALAINESYYGANHPEVAEVATDLSNALRNLGDYEEAQKLHERSLVINKKHYGSDTNSPSNNQYNIIPAKTGIHEKNRQSACYNMDSNLRGNDTRARLNIINLMVNRYEYPEVASILISLSYVDEALGDQKLALQQPIEAHKIMADKMYNTTDAYAERIQELQGTRLNSSDKDCWGFWDKYLMSLVRQSKSFISR